jgi:hypothetical protein
VKWYLVSAASSTLFVATFSALITAQSSAQILPAALAVMFAYGSLAFVPQPGCCPKRPKKRPAEKPAEPLTRLGAWFGITRD